MINCLLKDGFEILSLKNSHIEAYERIQLIDTHRDPFDRLLLATSLSENIPIISADEKRRTIQTKLDENLSKQNVIAKEIGDLFKQGKKEEADKKKGETEMLTTAGSEQGDFRGDEYRVATATSTDGE